MTEVTLRRVGSSLVTTVPVEAVQRLKLREGQHFDVQIENGRLILAPQSPAHDDVKAAHERVINQYRSVFEKLSDA